MISRVHHIDVAKGLSIFFVVLYHSKVRLYLPDIVEPMSLFRMPFFFFLSGVFLRWNTPPKDFLLSKAEALLKPYFSVLFALILYDLIIGNNVSLGRIGGVFYGNGDTIDWAPMWFLPHLFVLYLFAYLLIHYFKIHTLKISVICAILFLFIFIGSQSIQIFWYQNLYLAHQLSLQPGLPFSLDLILITSVYFLSGFLLRKNAVSFKGNQTLFFFAFLIFSGIWVFTDAYMDLNKRVFTQALYSIIASACGIYSMMYISMLITKRSWLYFIPSKLGEASLYILIFHSPIQRVFYAYFSQWVANESALMLIGVLAFIFSIILSLVIKTIIARSNLLSLFFLPIRSNKLFQKPGHEIYDKRQHPH